MNEDEGNLALKDCLGATVTAFFHAKKDLDIFSGHFPGNPVLPGSYSGRDDGAGVLFYEQQSV